MLRVAAPFLALALICTAVAMFALRGDTPPAEQRALAGAPSSTARSETATTPARRTATPTTPPAALDLPVRIPGHDREPGSTEPRVAAPLGRYGLAAVAPGEGWSFQGVPTDGSSLHTIPEEERRLVVPMPASALGFGWPVQGVITSIFSERHPLGIDVGPLDAEALVLAARDGVVMFSGGDACCSYGYYVILDHGDGVTSIYGHLREPSRVKVGEWLPRGTVLGIAGNTGHSFGVHLHFEVRVCGVPVDPEAAITEGVLSPVLRPLSPAEAAAEADHAHDDESAALVPATPTETPIPSPTPEESTPTPEATGGPEPGSTATTPPGSPQATAAPANTATPSSTATPAGAATVQPTQTSTATVTGQAGTGADPSATPALTSATPTPVPATAPATATPTAPARTATAAATATTVSGTATATTVATSTATVAGGGTPATTTTPATPTTTATPDNCERVRGAVAGSGAGAGAGFVRLVSTGEGVRSLLAERCPGKDVATLTVTTTAGQVCTAAFTLGAVPGTSLTLLRSEPVEGGLRHLWTFAPGVTAGASITIACAPADTAALPASGGSDTIATPAGR